LRPARGHANGTMSNSNLKTVLARVVTAG
jgi:hypothetical protein